jgi:hypothetical protein
VDGISLCSFLILQYISYSMMYCIVTAKYDDNIMQVKYIRVWKRKQEVGL